MNECLPPKHSEAVEVYRTYFSDVSITSVVLVLLQMSGSTDPVSLLSVQHWSISFGSLRNKLQVNKDGCSVRTHPVAPTSHT